MLEYLPICFWREISVRQWMLGIDDVTIVSDVRYLMSEVRCIANIRVDIQQLAHFLSDSLVEIEQIVVFLLEEGMQVVCIVFKERAFAIGTLQGIPMDAPPLVVVANANILEQTLFSSSGFAAGH